MILAHELHILPEGRRQVLRLPHALAWEACAQGLPSEEQAPAPGAGKCAQAQASDLTSGLPKI